MGGIQQSVGARLLTAAEIASGLVVQDFEIILAPQIEVVSALDFGPVYVGVVSQRQLLITNSGSAELQVSAISGPGLSAEPASFHLPAAESQSVLVSLTAEAVGSFSQALLISNNDTDVSVEVSAEVEEELAAVVSTQLLTVGGRVSGVLQGQIEVQILAGVDDSLLHSQQGIVEAGSYRLTLMDLSTSAPASAKFSSQNKIQLELLDPSGQSVELTAARWLQASEIASGLVVQDFEIILAPQIEVASALDFGQ